MFLNLSYVYLLLFLDCSSHNECKQAVSYTLVNGMSVIYIYKEKKLPRPSQKYESLTFNTRIIFILNTYFDRDKHLFIQHKFIFFTTFYTLYPWYNLLELIPF